MHDTVRPPLSQKLKNPKGNDLYTYWGSKLAECLNEELDKQPEESRFVINCASQVRESLFRTKTIRSAPACVHTQNTRNLCYSKARSMQHACGLNTGGCIRVDPWRCSPYTVVPNLSQEYWKAIDTKALKYPVVECNFPAASVHTKTARGMMARFAIKNRVSGLR